MPTNNFLLLPNRLRDSVDRLKTFQCLLPSFADTTELGEDLDHLSGYLSSIIASFEDNIESLDAFSLLIQAVRLFVYGKIDASEMKRFFPAVTGMEV
jgi:hypothetical protein